MTNKSKRELDAGGGEPVYQYRWFDRHGLQKPSGWSECTKESFEDYIAHPDFSRDHEFRTLYAQPTTPPAVERVTIPRKMLESWSRACSEEQAAYAPDTIFHVEQMANEITAALSATPPGEPVSGQCEDANPAATEVYNELVNQAIEQLGDVVHEGAVKHAHFRETNGMDVDYRRCIGAGLFKAANAGLFSIAPPSTDAAIEALAKRGEGDAIGETWIEHIPEDWGRYPARDILRAKFYDDYDFQPGTKLYTAPTPAVEVTEEMVVRAQAAQQDFFDEHKMSEFVDSLEYTQESMRAALTASRKGG